MVWPWVLSCMRHTRPSHLSGFIPAHGQKSARPERNMNVTTLMRFDCRQLAALCLCGLAWALAAGHARAQNPSPAKTAPGLAADPCLMPAAQRHGVNPHILRAILQVESGMRPHVVSRNRNGSIDVGMAQINSIHFRELAQWGITPERLLDPCVATHVAAWHLKRVMLRHGNTWFGVAAYHSATPIHNQRYQALLRQELVRTGVWR